MHHPTDRIAHTTAFVTPVVEHLLERQIAQWVHCLVTLIQHLGPWTSTEMQMKRYVLNSYCLHGVVPGAWVVVGRSLDRTSMSRMLMSHLCAISGGWLQILATSEHACRRLVQQNDFTYTDR